MLAEETRRAGAEVWACCLMPNDVHLILVPARDDGLVTVRPVLDRVASFAELIEDGADDEVATRALSPRGRGRKPAARVQEQPVLF